MVHLHHNPSALRLREQLRGEKSKASVQRSGGTGMKQDLCDHDLTVAMVTCTSSRKPSRQRDPWAPILSRNALLFLRVRPQVGRPYSSERPHAHACVGSTNLTQCIIKKFLQEETWSWEEVKTWEMNLGEVKRRSGADYDQNPRCICIKCSNN